MNTLNNTLAIIPRINKGLISKQPIDIIDLEEEEKTSKVGSPKSTLSCVTGKRFGGDREVISDEEEGGNRGGSESSGGERKKLRLCKEQILVLEQAFSEHTTLNTKQKVALATEVNLRPRQVEVWFQNRRARTKFKQTESDCEQLKKYCETLTEENKRLQNEVQELRALKFSPEHSMMEANHPPTTLTMCPSCKNVSFSSSSATTKTPAGETGRSLLGVFHQRTPLTIQ
uniref:Homeobox domain-containing protein n=2 Tax=Chenopodium quinoa TaxID=63459 RepID=A0A803M4Q4_CHEQI